jgi:RNA polymerase sigma-70 factor (ECF subfamily)
VTLSDIDRDLLQDCLERKPRAWEAFVDRFLGLVMHVINHTAQSRSIRLTVDDSEDLAAEVFLAIVNDDFGVLRRFRGDASLATYLAVIARRVVVKELLRRKTNVSISQVEDPSFNPVDQSPPPDERLSERDEIERLLDRLDSPDREVVRMFYVEGKTYQEISKQVGMPENTIGSTLSRAKDKLRRSPSGSGVH